MKTVVLLTVLWLCFLSLQAQPLPTPPEVSTANQLFQARDYDGAIKTLEAYFQRNPTAQLGWMLLGNAYRQKGNLDKALEMQLKAITVRQTRWQASVNAAAIHVLKNDKVKAFALLQSVRDGGSYDMDLVLSQPDFASLREDARFAKLKWTPADFANPFVEPVKIIHEWVGENKNDQFGWVARSIGDVDGDKVKDFVTSAPTFQVNQQPAGRIYIYSGKSGKLLWQQTGQGNDNLGQVIEGAGDVNHDGIPDVIAGAPGGNKAYVYSGKDGKVLLTLTGKDASESFGAPANRAGDQNGDGYDDVVVGAPGNGQSIGKVYVFSGKDGTVLFTFLGAQAGDGFGSTVAGYKKGDLAFISIGAPTAGPRRTGQVYVYAGLTKTPKFTIDSDETGARLGMMFQSLVGDVNKDNVPDIYASDWANAAKGPSTGRIYVHSGADGKRLYTLTGEAAGDGFGIGTADVGDVNKDGYDDLLIGAWQHASAAPSGGRVYLYSGKDGSLLRTMTCRIPGDTFGFDATGLGDVDGDGVNDFLLTSAWSNIKGYRSGRVFVISGRAVAPRVKLTFTPEAEKFDSATEEYRRIWQTEGDRMIETMEQVSGRKYHETAVNAIVFEGPSESGYQEKPMKMRASYPTEIKKATLLHEIGHRHLSQLRQRPRDIDEHRLLFLWLYDAWVKLYGHEFADNAVKVESARKGIYDYEGAWKWALSLSPAERAAKFKEVLQQN
ncbi:MAG: FG-GAP-like repeat-containing protein [Blastocatellia bacterium]